MSDLPTTAAADQQDERLDARSMAELTIDLIESFQCKPTPQAYEVFYAYAAKSPPVIRAEVDAAAGPEHALRIYDLQRIHHRYFRSVDEDWARQDRASEVTETSIGEALALIDAHVRTGARFGQRLETASGALASARTPDQVNRIVEGLIEENDAACKAHVALTSTLTGARERIAGVRSEIATARTEGQKDPLTDLGNWHGLESELERAVRHAIANGLQLALCLIDIDGFRAVNETFDTATGDAVLRYLGQMVPRHVQPDDKVFRHGGEEFAVIMPGHSVRQAFGTAQDLRRQIEKMCLTVRESGREVGQITASFGLVFLASGDSAESLRDRAVGMLRDAKGKGGNRVVSDTRPML